jgi:hypothetical protein
MLPGIPRCTTCGQEQELTAEVDEFRRQLDLTMRCHGRGVGRVLDMLQLENHGAIIETTLLEMAARLAATLPLESTDRYRDGYNWRDEPSAQVQRSVDQFRTEYQQVPVPSRAQGQRPTRRGSNPNAGSPWPPPRPVLGNPEPPMVQVDLRDPAEVQFRNLELDLVVPAVPRPVAADAPTEVPELDLAPLTPEQEREVVDRNLARVHRQTAVPEPRREAEPELDATEQRFALLELD